MSGPERWVLGILLAAATLLLLSSIGGAMAYAWPLLFPLLWYAASWSGRAATVVWTILAALSSWEAAFIYQYLLTGSESLVVPVLVPCSVIVLFVVTTWNRRSPARRALWDEPP
jgi:hypothetical protein